MKFKLKILILLLLIFLVSLTFSEGIDDIIKYFKYEIKTDKVILKWFPIKIDEVKEFVIERSMDGFNYTELKKLAPSGSEKEYMYIDDTLFKATSRIYYYRLKVVSKNGTFLYTDPIKILPKISDIRQTWGTIKAIFQ